MLVIDDNSCATSAFDNVTVRSFYKCARAGVRLNKCFVWTMKAYLTVITRTPGVVLVRTKNRMTVA